MRHRLQQCCVWGSGARQAVAAEGTAGELTLDLPGRPPVPRLDPCPSCPLRPTCTTVEGCPAGEGWSMASAAYESIAMGEGVVRSVAGEPTTGDPGCDGDDPPPLLAGPGEWRRQGSVWMSGEIVDGRGVHSKATFGHGPHHRELGR